MENQKVYVAIGCDGKIRCIFGDRASCEKYCENYSDLFLAEMTTAQSKKLYYSDFKGAGIEDYAKAIKELCAQKFSRDNDEEELELICNCPFYKKDDIFGAICSLTGGSFDVPKWWEID